MITHLAARRMLRRRVALVVAHPDDETIGAGAQLALLPELLLVHVTDGAPADGADARRAGFDSPAAYAAARRGELANALRVAGVAPERLALGVPDQGAAETMEGIAASLASAFRAHGTELVLTHPYEGGHPDHDATAWAVHHAAGERPVIEMAGYHAATGEFLAGEFLPAPPPLQSSWPGLTRPSTTTPDSSHLQPSEQSILAHTELGQTQGTDGRVKPGHDGDACWTAACVYPATITIELTPDERARKQAMLDCFTTQQDVLRLFNTSRERLRPAPAYDFTQPPHAGLLNYERWGFAMTGARWRQLAGRKCAA